MSIAEEANKQIRELKPVESARDDINKQMLAIAGEELSQKNGTNIHGPYVPSDHH